MTAISFQPTAISRTQESCLRHLQAAFDQAHQAIQDEPDDSDREDAENDVFVDQTVVFLPQEAADSGCSRQHLGCDDHQPRDPQAQPKASEHVRQRRGQQNFQQRLGA